jgi:lipopolysaccharide transport system ATP-binding protein
MSEIAIQVERLGKQYRIGQRELQRNLREVITDGLSAPFRRNTTMGSDRDDTIWALRDVSFEVKRGEALGIIGRNGAGKSTLLKILSRITEPTEGWASIGGRVGTLLEVGTGFHAELTGRENIYLSGAILGMKNAEIKRRFDEIVTFAEIDKFLDTPIKHYSSGMHMRLAFAVAAHLEPDILLVDEVLAVGDAAFQKKCLGKMGDVAKRGRTVLFVSHNLGSLANLCPRAVLLVQGCKRSEGDSNNVIAEYIAMGTQTTGERVWHDVHLAPGNETVRLHSVRIISAGEMTADVDVREDVHIQIEFWNLKEGTRVTTSVHLLDKTGVPVLASANLQSANLVADEWFDRPHPKGLYRAVCTIPGNFLNEGMYTINAFALTDVTRIEAAANEVVSFTVHDTGAMRKEYGGTWIGVVRPKLAWQTVYLQPVDTVE